MGQRIVRNKSAGFQKIQLPKKVNIIYVIGLALLIIAVFFSIIYRPVSCSVDVFQNSVFPPQEIRIVSDCKPAELRLDGEPIQFDYKYNGTEYRANITLNLPVGEHKLEIITEEGTGEKTAAFTISSKIKECEPGIAVDCLTAEGCDGKQDCINYQWTACEKNKMTCTPGSKRPCAVVECQVGHKTCNTCGTGYGPCLPE